MIVIKGSYWSFIKSIFKAIYYKYWTSYSYRFAAAPIVGMRLKISIDRLHEIVSMATGYPTQTE